MLPLKDNISRGKRGWKNGKFKFNRPFPSCFEPHCQSEAKCKVFIMKISFLLNADNAYFNMKRFVLSLAFVMRFTATRK